MGKKILLMYISEHSGHHQASIALEKAILAKDPSSQVFNINSFKYTNPVMEMVTHKTYMRVIKKRPDIWARLYDNPDVIKKTERMKNIVHTTGSRKIARLIKRLAPHAIACTQAFPCGLVAECKRRHGVTVPLVGILTDYAPHSYWIHKDVDAYVVPSAEVKAAFVKKEVPSQKIKTLGTPIDPLFEMALDKNKLYNKINLSPKLPVILVMGGTHGMGLNGKLIKALDNCKKDFQIIMVTGLNKKLFKKVKKITPTLRKKIIVLGFASNVHELMEISDIIITKPGGLTTAEALAKSLPMVILNPLPGQEDLNTKALTRKGIAVKASDEYNAVKFTEELLDNPTRMKEMRKAIKANAKPRSAIDVSELLLTLAN